MEFEAVSSRQRVPVAVGDRMPAKWEPAPNKGLGPSLTQVEQPSQKRKEVLLWSEEHGVNMWQSVSVSNSPLTYKQHQHIRIKCARYIFVNRCVRLLIKVVIMFLLTSACKWVYNVVLWSAGKGKIHLMTWSCLTGLGGFIIPSERKNPFDDLILSDRTGRFYNPLGKEKSIWWLDLVFLLINPGSVLLTGLSCFMICWKRKNPFVGLSLSFC